MTKLLYPLVEKDFINMAKCSIHSGDIDPVYPILKSYFDKNNLDNENRLWCCLIYLYCYNLPWALELYNKYSSLEIANKNKIWEAKCLLNIKIGSDRRGIYWSGGLALALEKLVRFLLPYKNISTYLEKYVPKEDTQKDEDSLYIRVNKAIKNLPNSGVWSAFKYSDLITQTSDEINLNCIDLFVRERLAGPGEALLGLFGQRLDDHKWLKDNYKLVEEKLNYWTKEIGNQINNTVTWNKNFKMTWFETETVLCNYHSICVGSYYLGMDLDDMYIKIRDKWKYNIFNTDKFILDKRKELFNKENLIEYSNRIFKQDIKKYRIKCYKCTNKEGLNI